MGKELIIWYDGQCALCLRSREWCISRDRQGRIDFRDFNSEPDGALPAPRDELSSSMWLRDTDGALYSGFAAWRRILRVLPRWRWLATVAGMAPMRWLGPPTYRLLARWRHLLPVASPAACERREIEQRMAEPTD